MSFDLKRRAVIKAAYCAARPSLWRGLANGVAPTIEHARALSNLAPRTVIDVGANRGQFSLFARRQFPEAEIHSLEPLPGPARTFEAVFRGDKRTHLTKVAIGDSEGKATITVASREDSSSLLKPLEETREIYGVSALDTIEVDVRTLDALFSNIVIRRPALLKIDVQGFELCALRGGNRLLQEIDHAYVECSYVPLYSGQALAGDIVEYMEQAGFRLRGVFNQDFHPAHGPVQGDFLFSRAESVASPAEEAAA